MFSLNGVTKINFGGIPLMDNPLKLSWPEFSNMRIAPVFLDKDNNVWERTAFLPYRPFLLDGHRTDYGVLFSFKLQEYVSETQKVNAVGVYFGSLGSPHYYMNLLGRNPHKDEPDIVYPNDELNIKIKVGAVSIEPRF